MSVENLFVDCKMSDEVNFWVLLRSKVFGIGQISILGVSVWCAISSTITIGPYFFEVANGLAVTFDVERFTENGNANFEL